MSWNFTEPQPQTVWQTLKGRAVRITWRHSFYQTIEWYYFRVEAADSEWVRLQGMDQPKGLDEIGMKIADEYRGGPIVVRLADIEMAEVVEAA